MEKEKGRKHHKNPSFSSTLLDEIYRSIDGYDHQMRQDLKLSKENTINRHNSSKSKGVKSSSIEDEEIASFTRARLIEKYMEKKVKEKVSMNRKMELENDPLFFSSSSSDSSSGTLSATSSEADSFYSEKSSRSTCFAVPRTKSNRRIFDDCNKQSHEDYLMKSKSRAFKLYDNMKKVKQPISPGARLTTFLTSIFNNKKSNVAERNSNSKSVKASRSCFSKTPPKFQNGVKRTVRFDPVGIVIDEDSRPVAHKCIYDKETDDAFQIMEKSHVKKNDYSRDEDEDEDAASDSSSDLFEIDHLAFFGNNRFCEELPVYETTHLHTNRGLASIRN